MYRASGGTYAFVLAVGGIATVMSAVMDFKSGSLSPLSWFTMSCLLLGVVWARAFKLELSNSQIRFRSLFGCVRTVELSQLETARLEIGYKEYGASVFSPMVRVRLMLNDRTSVVINAKVFPLEALHELEAITMRTRRGR